MKLCRKVVIPNPLEIGDGETGDGWGEAGMDVGPDLLHVVLETGNPSFELREAVAEVDVRRDPAVDCFDEGEKGTGELAEGVHDRDPAQDDEEDDGDEALVGDALGDRWEALEEEGAGHKREGDGVSRSVP